MFRNDDSEEIDKAGLTELARAANLLAVGWLPADSSRNGESI